MLVRVNRVSNACDGILAGCFKGEGHWLSLANTSICILVLMRGKKLLKERRNIAVGKRVGYDGRRLGDDRGGCSNREAPDCANNGALERFIGVGVID